MTAPSDDASGVVDANGGYDENGWGDEDFQQADDVPPTTVLQWTLRPQTAVTVRQVLRLMRRKMVTGFSWNSNQRAWKRKTLVLVKATRQVLYRRKKAGEKVVEGTPPEMALEDGSADKQVIGKAHTSDSESRGEGKSEASRTERGAKRRLAGDVVEERASNNTAELRNGEADSANTRTSMTNVESSPDQSSTPSNGNNKPSSEEVKEIPVVDQEGDGIVSSNAEMLNERPSNAVKDVESKEKH